MKSNLETAISDALDILYSKDKYLISHKPFYTSNENDIHVSERGIVFRFGIYFQEIFNQSHLLLNYNIDTEYNRNFDKPKTLPNTPWEDGHGAYPDLIVHERGSNNSNLLIIEFKTWWSDPYTIDLDRTKLKAFKEPPYNYKYALLVVLNKTEPTLEWITDTLCNS